MANLCLSHWQIIFLPTNNLVIYWAPFPPFPLFWGGVLDKKAKEQARETMLSEKQVQKEASCAFSVLTVRSFLFLEIRVINKSFSQMATMHCTTYPRGKTWTNSLTYIKLAEFSAMSFLQVWRKVTFFRPFSAWKWLLLKGGHCAKSEWVCISFPQTETILYF